MKKLTHMPLKSPRGVAKVAQKVGQLIRYQKFLMQLEARRTAVPLLAGNRISNCQTNKNIEDEDHRTEPTE